MDGGIPTYTPPPLQPTKWRTAPGFFGDQHRMDNTQLRNPTELPNNQTELYTMRTDDGLLWTHTLDLVREIRQSILGVKRRGGGEDEMAVLVCRFRCQFLPTHSFLMFWCVHVVCVSVLSPLCLSSFFSIFTHTHSSSTCTHTHTHTESVSHSLSGGAPEEEEDDHHHRHHHHSLVNDVSVYDN